MKCFRCPITSFRTVSGTGLLLLLAVFLCFSGAARAAEVTITPDRVRGWMDRFLEESRDMLPDAEVSFTRLNLPEPFSVPDGDIRAQVLPSDTDILSSRRFSLTVYSNGRAVDTRTVYGELQALAPVVVLAENVRRGEILDAQDLLMAEMDIVRLRRPCLDPEEVVGKTLRRTGRRGDVVSKRFLTTPDLVRRNQVVTISLQKGGLFLTTRGVARMAGGKGETIRVRNISSNREIFCRVTGPNRVRVIF